MSAKNTSATKFIMDLVKVCGYVGVSAIAAALLGLGVSVLDGHAGLDVKGFAKKQACVQER